jgi:transcriptional regulator with XRE-family HTH domain
VADPRKILGRTIRKRREELGMTQENLAEKAELHWTYVSGIERGVRNVTILKLSNIARALNLRVRDLVDDL